MHRYIPFLLIILFNACKPPQAPPQPTTVVHQQYKITEKLPVDSSVYRMILPYKDSVSKVMDKVIGFSLQNMYRKQPESALGNFLTDAMRSMGEKRLQRPMDVAIINYGGIRAELPKGNVTMRNVFEIMPFDNALVLIEMNADQLMQLMDFIAEHGGWPISGASMKIINKKASDVKVNGRPLEKNRKYVVGLSDYVANGGDDAGFLKNYQQYTKGYVLRDAFIEHIQMLTKEGKAITANIENRIIHAN